MCDAGGAVEAVYFTLKGHEGSRYWQRVVRDAGAGRVVDVTNDSFDAAAATINGWQVCVCEREREREREREGGGGREGGRERE